MPCGKQSLKTDGENGYLDWRDTETRQVQQEEEDMEEGKKDFLKKSFFFFKTIKKISLNKKTRVYCLRLK